LLLHGGIGMATAYVGQGALLHSPRESSYALQFLCGSHAAVAINNERLDGGMGIGRLAAVHKPILSFLVQTSQSPTVDIRANPPQERIVRFQPKRRLNQRTNICVSLARLVQDVVPELIRRSPVGSLGHPHSCAKQFA